MLIKKIDKKLIVICAIGFALFFALAMLFPFAGDDWAWGSQIGIERLNTWFKDYNGRYAGNLLVLLLTRSKALSAALVSASIVFFSLITYFTLKVKNIFGFLLSTLLFLTMPCNIFAQGVAWMSGFANYVPSILITVFCTVLMQNIFESEKPKYPFFYIPLLGIVSFISSLFIETVTILNVVLGFLIVFYSLFKFKRVYAANIAFLVGSATGAICMFSNGAYRHIANSDDFYRETAFTGKLTNFIESVFAHGNQIFSGLVLNNMLTFFIFSALCILTGILYVKKSENKTKKRFIYINSGVNILCLFLLFAKKNYPYWLLFTHFRKPEYLTYTAFYMITAVFMLTVAIQVLICIDDKSIRDKLPFYMFCTLILVAPLFVVDPIGPRCFFAPYVTMMVFEVIYINYLLIVLKADKKTVKQLSCGALAGIAACTIFIFTIYIPINHYAALRDEYVKAQAAIEGREVIYICKLPYSSFVWTGNPASNDLLRDRYLLFNNIETDARLVGKNYDEFEKWAKGFNKKTGYKPKHKLRKIETRFYRSEKETEPNE